MGVTKENTCDKIKRFSAITKTKGLISYEVFYSRENYSTKIERNRRLDGSRKYFNYFIFLKIRMTGNSYEGNNFRTL